MNTVDPVRTPDTPGWKWRTAKGTFTAPADMETSHLYNALRLAWNWISPPEVKIPGGSGCAVTHKFYTPQYLTQAVYCLLLELDTRTDRSIEMEVHSHLVHVALSGLS